MGEKGNSFNSNNRSFASVGRAVLIQALGIKASYKEKNEMVLEQKKNTHCKNCPYFSLSDRESVCKACSHYELEPKHVVKYIDEENMYGKKERLSMNAIKVLLYLHFSKNIDSNGLIRDVSLAEIAGGIGICKRTVHNIINELSNKDYIAFAPSFKGKRDIFIRDYIYYFREASKGGRGYVVLNDELLKKLLSVKEINVLRVYLRAIMDVDKAAGKDNYTINTIKKSLIDIVRELPSYARKNTVKELVNSLSDGIFHISEDVKGTFKFTLNEIFMGKKTRKRALNRYKTELKEYVSFINECMIDYVRNPEDDLNPLCDYISSLENVNPVLEKDFNFNNLACLVDWFSIDQIKESINLIVKRMCSTDYNENPIKDICAYARTIIQNSIAGSKSYFLA